MLTKLSHNKSDCTEPANSSGGGGAGRQCHNCKKEGHISRECPEPRVFRCRNCDEEGHQSRECPKPTDWSRVKCKNCDNLGHGARRCPEPVREEATGGDWGNAGGDSGAAGGWATGGADASAPAASTGDWADESTAAANGGDSWGGAAATTGW
jgi:cellular nucleic acid-binding protein